jgi:phage-related protein
MPNSRPLPGLGPGCHEFRIRDEAKSWRIIYHLSDEAAVLLEVFSKKSGRTPGRVFRRCQRRLASYLAG